MDSLSDIKKAYFIGIGGIGMSALARFFLQRGAQVGGYDRAESELTRQLSAEGAHIHYADDPNLLWPDAELVVYTPAIPSGNAELSWYRGQGREVYKRSDVLQWIAKGHHAITVAGTHGKTTVSAMIAHLLRDAGFGGTAFLGGIAANYNTNFWSGHGDTVVVEADEYDRSFLKLHPDLAVLTAMDPDHLDIYGTVEAMEEAYIQYTQNLAPGGKLFVKYGLKRSADLHVENAVTYSLQNSAADVYASNIRQHEGGYIFDLVNPSGFIPQLQLPLGGMHNVENAVVAAAVAIEEGLSPQDVKAALAAFQGVKRRFEYVLKNERHVYIDDYAHHPEELAALISSARRLFPKLRCVVAFQPHLFSRTRDLAAGFAHSLDMADEVILLEIYPARELPIEGVTARTIAERMQNPAHTVMTKEALLDWVSAARPELLITAGAGDIDRLAPLIKQRLS
jgi:UDP-N-acetylmuramate--alanine ligase